MTFQVVSTCEPDERGDGKTTEHGDQEVRTDNSRNDELYSENAGLEKDNDELWAELDRLWGMKDDDEKWMSDDINWL